MSFVRTDSNDLTGSNSLFRLLEPNTLLHDSGQRAVNGVVSNNNTKGNLLP